MPPRASQTNDNDITKLNQPQPNLIRMMNNIFYLPTHAHSTYSVLFCSVLYFRRFIVHSDADDRHLLLELHLLHFNFT